MKGLVPYTINAGGTLIDLSEPQVMGILNVTPDSFYSSSRMFDEEAIACRTRQILDEGGTIIDVGAYSTRPGSDDVSEDEEARRLRMALATVRKIAPEAIVSIDTFRASIARMCVEEFGANIINDVSGGDADNDAYSIGVYGTWMADNGLFLDVIGKYGRLSNDFSINHIDGSFDNNAYSLSAEIGWRFEPCSFGFIEPQAELTYGRIDGDTFRAGNVRFEQGDFDSLVGRVGVRVGAKFPDDRGNLYLRVSGAYDFQGDYDNTVTSLVGAHRKLSEDLGGAWIETAIGGNFRLTDSTNAWVDLERNNGGEVVENWRWNIGLRTEF